MVLNKYFSLLSFTLLLVLTINSHSVKSETRLISQINNHNLPGTEKTLTVAMGSSLKPMHFLNEQGKLVGFEVDIVTMFAKSIGVKLKIIDPKSVNSSSLNLLLSKKADMAVNSLNITRERKQWVNFSEPYFESRTGLVVSAKAKKEFNISNATLISVYGGMRYGLSKENRKIHYGYSNGRTSRKTYDEAYKAIENQFYPDFSGYVLSNDWFSLNKLDKTKFKVLDFAVGSGEYGVAFRKNDERYRTKWNEFIKEIKTNRFYKKGLYQETYNKWFTKKPMPPIVSMEKYKGSYHCLDYISELNLKADSNPDVRKRNISKAFEKNPSLFLPLINCNSTMYYKSGKRVGYYQLIFPLIEKSYKDSYGKRIKELHEKSHSNGNENEIKNSYSDLILNAGVIEMLPPYFSRNYNTGTTYQKYFVTAFYQKHEKLRNRIIGLYDDSINKLTNEKYKFGFSGELSIPTLKFTLKEKNKNKPTTIKFSARNFNYNQNYNIRVVKSYEMVNLLLMSMV